MAVMLLLFSEIAIAEFRVVVGSDLKATEVTINDGDTLDLEPARDIIWFEDVVPQGRGWGASCTVRQDLADEGTDVELLGEAGIIARISLTNCIIGHRGTAAVEQGAISFFSDTFGVVLPPVQVTLELDGEFIKVGPPGPLPPADPPNPIDNAQITLSNFVREVSTGCFGNRCPKPNPANANAPFRVGEIFNFDGAINNISGNVSFTLGPSPSNGGGVDGIRLPSSARISISVITKVPTMGIFTLLSLAVLLLITGLLSLRQAI